jgi:hypothetical protein
VDDDRARVVALIAQQTASPADHHGVMGSLRRLCTAAAQALSASGAAEAVMAKDGRLACPGAWLPRPAINLAASRRRLPWWRG